MDKVTASNNIGEIFARWPLLITIFIEYDMSCPGCFLAAFENLEDALEVYKVPVEPFVQKLNWEIEKARTNIGEQ